MTWINPLSKPASAGPRDRRVGEDDAGNPVFETVTGERYTVTPQALAADEQARQDGLLGMMAAQKGEPFTPGYTGRAEAAPSLGGILGAMEGGAITRKSAYDQYHRVAGEVEARNVEYRRKMTAEQRRKTPPWDTQDVYDHLQLLRGLD